jgi:hypothetical protein
MTVSKVSISLDPVIAERARADVAAGRASSLSAWLNDAGRAWAEAEDLQAVLEEIFDETGGKLSDHELDIARRRLAEADRH